MNPPSTPAADGPRSPRYETRDLLSAHYSPSPTRSVDAQPTPTLRFYLESVAIGTGLVATAVGLVAGSAVGLHSLSEHTTRITSDSDHCVSSACIALLVLVSVNLLVAMMRDPRKASK
jgi:hypothetical protein